MMSIIQWFSFLLCFSAMIHAGEKELVFKQNFEHYQESKVYQQADWESDWQSQNWQNGVTEGRVKVAASKKGACLAVTYPANKIGSKDSGAQWKYTFNKAYEAATLRYRIKFAKDFDFVRGGKLPGLVGGPAPPTGAKHADGLTGWSARFMWRDEGTALAYTQHVHSGRDKDGTEEDRDYWKGDDSQRFQFERDRWYTLEQKIGLNDSDKKNGQLKIRVDGQLVVSRDDIQFRKTDKIKIDKLYFSTFFGGSDASWQPSKDETIFFDDFEVYGYPKVAVDSAN